MKRRRKPRVYRLRDLADMAEQLGCRLRFEMIPVELLRRSLVPEPKTDTTPKTKQKNGPRS